MAGATTHPVSPAISPQGGLHAMVILKQNGEAGTTTLLNVTQSLGLGVSACFGSNQRRLVSQGLDGQDLANLDDEALLQRGLQSKLQRKQLLNRRDELLLLDEESNSTASFNTGSYGTEVLRHCAAQSHHPKALHTCVYIWLMTDVCMLQVMEPHAVPEEAGTDKEQAKADAASSTEPIEVVTLCDSHLQTVRFSFARVSTGS